MNTSSIHTNSLTKLPPPYPPQPQPKQSVQQFHTEYSIFNSNRYPLVSGHYNFGRGGRVSGSSRSKGKVGGQDGVGRALGRVRSSGSLVGRDLGMGKGYGGESRQYTVITQLPDLQYSSSRFQPQNPTPIPPTSTLHHPQPQTRTKTNSKTSESMTQLQTQLDQLKQQTIYKNKQIIPTGHEKEQTYFGLFAAKGRYQMMKKSIIGKNGDKGDHGGDGGEDGGDGEGRNGGDGGIGGGNRVMGEKSKLEEEVLNVRKEYNRLRNYMEDLQETARKLKEENARIARSNNELKQDLKSYETRMKMCPTCHSTKKSKDQSLFSNGSSPKHIRHQDTIKSSKDLSEDIDVYELLGRAKQQILCRDQIISNLQSKITQILQSQPISLSTQNLNPISPFDLQPHQPNQPQPVSPNTSLMSTNIHQIKHYIQSTKTEHNNLTTKINSLSLQLNDVISKVQFYMGKYEELQRILLEKEVQIDLHVKYTRKVMAKLGFWQRVAGGDEEEDRSDTETTQQLQKQLWSTTEDKNIFDNRRTEQSYKWFPKTAESTKFYPASIEAGRVLPLYIRTMDEKV